MDENWNDANFAVFKVDMNNAFNSVSRQALLDGVANFFPELLPLVAWSNGSPPLLWHSLGCVSSQTGVQQGDPLGPGHVFCPSASQTSF